jgi:hypothetical protein
VVYENIETILGWNVTPHIYGKKTNTSFRKMGHVTIVNQDIKARRIAEDVRILLGDYGSVQLSDQTSLKPQILLIRFCICNENFKLNIEEVTVFEI